MIPRIWKHGWNLCVSSISALLSQKGCNPHITIVLDISFHESEPVSKLPLRLVAPCNASLCSCHSIFSSHIVIAVLGCMMYTTTFYLSIISYYFVLHSSENRYSFDGSVINFTLRLGWGLLSLFLLSFKTAPRFNKYAPQYWIVTGSRLRQRYHVATVR